MPIRPWTGSLADGALFFRMTDAQDPHLDTFDSGEPEVTGYFRSRQWFDAGRGESRPPVFQFGTDTDIVGYAALGFKNCGHPRETSPDRARYLVVFVTGIDRAFQGSVNPASATGERYATTLFRSFEEHFLPQKTAVGQYLRVRVENTRAIGFYRKQGFVEDAGGPLAEGYLVMRKLL